MQTLTTDSLLRMQGEQSDLTLVNVLDADAHRRAHLPGSANVPVSAADFEKKVEDLVGEKEAPVVVYCADQACDASPRAARRLEDAGFKEVYDYEGGIAAWSEANQALDGAGD